MNKSIDLCLMVKNEEKYIERCITSVKNYVENIYILDTGSDDKTVDICSKYTRHIYKKPFNGHFAQMRHKIMRKCTAEWILFLDGDEYFNKIDIVKLMSILSQIDKNTGGIKFYRYNFFSTGGWYTDQVVKMFRNYNHFCYDKMVTEKIEASIRSGGYDILEPDIILNHTGHCKSRDSRDMKTRKYINLLNSQLLETKEDALLYSYIGINSMNVGDMNVALTETKKGTEMMPDGIANHLFYGSVLRAHNRPLDALIEFETALELSRNSDARIMNMIGVVHLSRGDFLTARKIFENAIKINPTLIHILINMGLTYYFSNDIKEALKCFENVVSRNDAFLHYETDALLESNYCDCLSYETITNYAGLYAYISMCKNNLKNV